ncbi:NAD-dependent epimerase/dehydratase family protein [Massilia agilis]|uniref:NAD-dependent epimerase/dehydratase family protein n=1 Tax=Massilia agilis TaxID=1811226 RepID=A0ABT2D7Z3_9BURK|nr:NAD-dependent epimerase/dehydratase family protein [Massilia agilis]MCS0807431.1 NAD-dependent epimerase/dehydratase family protein [Massilia agilis]
MKVLVTGANGFIGKNLVVHLQERALEVLRYVRGDTGADLVSLVHQADFVFHLAGVNRPQNEAEFAEGNCDLTRTLCNALRESGRVIPVVYASSIQAERDNPYGASKRGAEDALCALAASTGQAIHIYRLPNVFGKWCRPYYNSVVATFCHNIVHGLPIQVNEPTAALRLAYIDDVIAAFLSHLDEKRQGAVFEQVAPVYETTVGQLAAQLYAFKQGREDMMTGPVGTGLVRALYSTYISYYEPAQFAYPLVKHEDARGVFVEMLKTADAGQFSYFTAHPGVTRGGHYHHTKTEKFLVIKGKARFRFRHIDTGATHEYCTSGAAPEVVETIPGWSHDITNIGDDEMVVMLWANEVFDRQKPDTVAYKV